jgi:hypothetical protein
MPRYWDSQFQPTFEPPPIAQLAAPPPAPWEWARLLEALSHGAWASAVIVRPKWEGPDLGIDRTLNNKLERTDIVIRAYDALLDVALLRANTLVKVEFYQPWQRWYVTNWKCFFTSY